MYAVIINIVLNLFYFNRKQLCYHLW